MESFVTIDRDTPILLPPDLRDGVPHGPLVLFNIDVIEFIDTTSAQINHPAHAMKAIPAPMLLALLVYSYCSGTFPAPVRSFQPQLCRRAFRMTLFSIEVEMTLNGIINFPE